MSALIHEFVRAARRAWPYALCVGAALSVSPIGCAGSDDVPVTEGTTTQGTTLPVVGDSLPSGAISFFKTPKCPADWAPFSESGGRLIVPTVGDDPTLLVKGTPLKDGEDRTHGHSLDAELTLTPVSYVGAPGGGNSGVANAQTIKLAAAGEKVSSGLPYVQLLACKKLGGPAAGAGPAPRGMMIFYNGTACPAGYTQPMATQGRVLVGLPDGATAGITFGGSALKAGESRVHGHDVNGTLATTPHGIALASGCCGDGYAKDGMYPYTGVTVDDGVDLPTIQVLQCVKN